MPIYLNTVLHSATEALAVAVVRVYDHSRVKWALSPLDRDKDVVCDGKTRIEHVIIFL